MNETRVARYRRAQSTRQHIKRLGVEKNIARLCIIRSARHIYVQVIAPKGGQILASASSLEKAFRETVKTGDTKTDCAKEVGKLLAERVKQIGLASVASDRSGYKYHGRVAALIQSARENGLVV